MAHLPTTFASLVLASVHQRTGPVVGLVGMRNSFPRGQQGRSWLLTCERKRVRASGRRRALLDGLKKPLLPHLSLLDQSLKIVADAGVLTLMKLCESQ
jgi:hypothetical protein